LRKFHIKPLRLLIYVDISELLHCFLFVFSSVSTKENMKRFVKIRAVISIYFVGLDRALQVTKTRKLTAALPLVTLEWVNVSMDL
jgi:hypothetical protein